MQALRFWVFLGLVFVLQEIGPTFAWGDATFKLPEAYNVLCDADPLVRMGYLRRYHKQLAQYGTTEEQQWLERYITSLAQLVGTPKQDIKYPVKLVLQKEPSSAPILSLDAYLVRIKSQPPLSSWALVDLTHPGIDFMRGVYPAEFTTDEGAIRAALGKFIAQSQYPSGYWHIEVNTPGVQFNVENAYSFTWSSPADSTQNWQLGNPIRFEGSGCQDWTSKESRKEGYAIKAIEDSKLASLNQAIKRVEQFENYQQGARLLHARAILQEGVVFLEKNAFKGIVLDAATAQAYLARRNMPNSKEKLNKTYQILGSGKKVEFANYDDFAKKFFYREHYKENLLRDKTQQLNLHIQPGWLAWREETEKLDKDIHGLVVDNKGCITGKRNDGSPFEVCGTLFKPPTSKKGTQTPPALHPNPHRYLFFATKKGEKIRLGQASVGEILHTHHGRILNQQGQMVAGLPLPLDYSRAKGLQQALGLLLRELPGATLEALSEVFSFSGLYDLSKSILLGSARQAILHFLGVGLLNDLWVLLTELRHGYAIYSMLSEFWEEIDSAKDEYQLYDASNKLRPLVKELVANAAKKEVIKQAGKYVDEQEEKVASAQQQDKVQQQKELKKSKESKELTVAEREKRDLISQKEKNQRVLKRAEKRKLYDALPAIEKLLLDTNKYFRVTRENAELALMGPAGTEPVVQGVGKEGADILFKDKQGKIVLKRELKCITSMDKLGDRISLAVKQLTHLSELFKEVMIQVPAESDAETTVKRFRGTIRKEKHRQEKYKNITLIVIDDSGQIRYTGPVLYEEKPEERTRVTD